MPEIKYQLITGIVVTIIIFLLVGFFIIVMVAFMNRGKKRHIEEKEIMQLNFQQELLRTQLEIQEQTLKNISLEIHDNIGQVLSLAKLNLGTIDIGSKNLEQKIDDSKKLVAKAIQDLRDLSKSLNTDYVVQMGLARSIEYEMEMIKKLGIYETIFEIEGKVYNHDQQKELILFRIVQEALNNIIKHAKASTISIKLQYQPERFSISIDDNGLGFNLSPFPENVNQRGGLGIKNMHNRAHLIGASFEIKSNVSQGTAVFIELLSPT